MDISIRVEGAETAKRHLLDMAERITDFRPVWPEVKAIVQRHEARWLGSSGEGTFAPLLPSTLKKGNRRSNRPLDKTGTMWDSLAGDTGYTFFSSEPHRCEIGTSTDWAHWHMFPRKHMPARPPVHITEGLIRDVNAVLRAHVRGGQASLL